MEINLAKLDKVIGVKQSHKAISEGRAKHVFIACDADCGVTDTIVALCRQANVGYEVSDTMKALGKACGIEVGASVVTLL